MILPSWIGSKQMGRLKEHIFNRWKFWSCLISKYGSCVIKQMTWLRFFFFFLSFWLFLPVPPPKLMAVASGFSLCSPLPQSFLHFVWASWKIYKYSVPSKSKFLMLSLCAWQSSQWRVGCTWVCISAHFVNRINSSLYFHYHFILWTSDWHIQSITSGITFQKI